MIMSTSNSQKIFNVHSRSVLRCQELAGKQNEKYFVLALQSAETFCKCLDPSKGNEHFGLTSQEATSLSEAKFEELYRLLLSFYALVLTEFHIDGTNPETITDTEKVVGSYYIQKLRGDSSIDSPDAPLRGMDLTDYRATVLVERIIGGRQHNVPQIRETLLYTAHKMLAISLEKVARGGCFIATAVYGSPFHSNVVLLRQLRDNHLLSTVWGRAFVHLYYRVGPKLARFVSTRRKLRTLIRTLLDAIVSAIRPNA